MLSFQAPFGLKYCLVVNLSGIFSMDNLGTNHFANLDSLGSSTNLLFSQPCWNSCQNSGLRVKMREGVRVREGGKFLVMDGLLRGGAV